MDNFAIPIPLNVSAQNHTIPLNAEAVPTGTTDYNHLTNRPSLNGVVIEGAHDSEYYHLYSVPETGIPKTDLASGVQESLDKADTALQEDDLEELTEEVDGLKSAFVGALDVENKIFPALYSDMEQYPGIADSAFYYSDRIVRKGELIKGITVGTKSAVSGVLVFIDGNNKVVFKRAINITSQPFEYISINYVPFTDITIAISLANYYNARTSVTEEYSFHTGGLYKLTQSAVELGDIVTITKQSSRFGAFPYQLDILSGNNFKATRPEIGYENFSVQVNYSDYTENADDSVVNYTDYGVIALPDNYSRTGDPTPLIIYCQGSGERTGQNTNPLSNYGWDYFLAKGFAVLDMNGVSTEWATARGFPITDNHYGVKYLLSSYAKGYKHAIDTYNLRKEVFVAGTSVGGGAAALIVQSNIIPVIANALFCPALSIIKQDYMKPWSGVNQQKTIAGQWNLPNWDTIDWDNTTVSFRRQYILDNIDKFIGFDNILLRANGDFETALNNYNNEQETAAYNSMTKVYPVPLKIWHCENDTTVLIRYSRFMVNMIKNAGGQAWLRSFETGGHYGGWDTGSVTDAGVTTSIPFYEAVMFFNRFI